MITENYCVLTPAYGRDFTTNADAEQNFRSGVDWMMQPSGCYCSIADFAKGVTVNLRFKKRTKVFPVMV